MSKFKVGDVFIDSYNNKYFITSFDEQTVWYIIARFNKETEEYTIDYDGHKYRYVFDYLIHKNELFPDTEAAKLLYGAKNEPKT